VIHDFKEAGIKVWMLTGDKLETAENIGISTRMFSDEMCIFRLNTCDKEKTKSRIEQVEERIKEFAT
jgi:magnesium-transporting ATPase (P-type)